jgi:hypothetical protein
MSSVPAAGEDGVNDPTFRTKNKTTQAKRSSGTTQCPFGETDEDSLPAVVLFKARTGATYRSTAEK